MTAQFGQAVSWYNDSRNQPFILAAQRQHASRDKQLAEMRVRANKELFTNWLFAKGHNDSVNKGLYLARELEHIMQEVVRTPRPDLSALALFDLDTSVPAGAEKFTVRRVEGTGRANYYDGAGSNIPAANVFREEESWPLHPIAAGYEWTLFDQMSSDFAGINMIDELRDATTYAIDEFINRKAFEGDIARQALGLMNQPYVPRAQMGITLGDATDGEDIAQEFLRLARYTSAVTENVFRPKRIVTSVRVANYLNERELGTFKEKSIAQRIVGASQYITEIVGVPELAGLGPNGEDVVLYDSGRDRKNGFSNVMAQLPTFLPVQQVGMKFHVPCYAIYGGLKTTMPLNSLIAFLQLDTGLEGVY